MNKTWKRVISLVFVLILLLSCEVPAFADSTLYPRTGTMNIYMDNSNGKPGTWTLTLASAKNTFTIKRSSVSVSGCGAKITRFQRVLSNYETDTIFCNPDEVGAYCDFDCSYSITLQVKRTGTVKIKYSIGSKEYTLRAKVLPYENPVKAIKVTGVNSSKSFASRTKTSIKNTRQLTLKETTKNASLVLKPAAGWKVNRVEFEDASTHFCYSFGNVQPDYRSGVSSLTLSLGTLRLSRNYYLRVRMYNPTTHCNVGFGYTIHGAKAAA